jgi:hypothetical protein
MGASSQILCLHVLIFFFHGKVDPRLTLEVAVLLVKKWTRRKSLKGTVKHSETLTNTLINGITLQAILRVTSDLDPPNT